VVVEVDPDDNELYFPFFLLFLTEFTKNEQ
jgi:hypothetical protein